MAYFDGSTSAIDGTDDNDLVILAGQLSHSDYQINTGNGNDSIYFAASFENSTYDFNVNGGSGIDRVIFSDYHNLYMEIGSFFWSGQFGESGNITGVENVYCSSGEDTVYGDAGNNLISGGDGGDSLYGDRGIDTVSYRDSTAAVAIDLGANTASGGYAEGDVLSGFERAWGSDHDDVLTGSDGRNTLLGFGGADSLSGGGMADLLRGLDGDDTLVGGTGGDTLAGGDGDDTFVFAGGDSGVWRQRDTIADFQSGDTISLAQIDASTGDADDQAFHFLGSGWFDGTAGALRYGVTADGVTILGDTDGDRHADFAIDVAGVVTLATDDFVL